MRFIRMLLGIATFAAQMSCVLLGGISLRADAPAATRPAAGLKAPPSTAPCTWVSVSGETPEYQNLDGPEVVLVARIQVTGFYVGKPEEATWRGFLQVDHPWLPVPLSPGESEAIDRIRGQRALKDMGGTQILLTAKVKRDRSAGKCPTIVPGSMRELGPDDKDWDMPWQVNLPLLPMAGDYIPIRMIVAGEATATADVRPSFSGSNWATQEFKVSDVFWGQATKGQTLRITYCFAPWKGRSLSKGEKVIWVLTSEYGYGAVPDTPHHREQARELAARVKRTPAPTRCDLSDLDMSKSRTKTTREREVPDVFIEMPEKSGKWQVRPDVKVTYSGADGAVYFVPRDKVYYIRRDHYDGKGSKIFSSFFGPFKHDPSLFQTPKSE